MIVITPAAQAAITAQTTAEAAARTAELQMYQRMMAAGVRVALYLKAQFEANTDPSNRIELIELTYPEGAALEFAQANGRLPERVITQRPYHLSPDLGAHRINGVQVRYVGPPITDTKLIPWATVGVYA